MSITSETLSIVLAGGVGSRLTPLTRDRAKPAVPFGGPYRIIDFTLSNCLHSGLRQILVLSQYKSYSLHKHLRDAWSVFNPELGEYITAVPPQLRTGNSWYSGTADAVYQNLFVVKRSGAQNVLILCGDHIYRMDYSAMLAEHKRTGADVTVGCMEVDLEAARAFGVMSVDSQNRIRSFEEKPDRPRPISGNPHRALVSMGIYVFSTELLCQHLEQDSTDSQSSHDFGRDLLPQLIHTHRVNAYRFGASPACGPRTSYWRDVGTIDAYYQTTMDLLKPEPPIDLHARCWPIRKFNSPAPPARIERDHLGVSGMITDSMLSNGVVVSGGEVHGSVLSPNVRINSGATVEDSILFDDVHVGAGTQLRSCIVDKGVRIPAGERIGFHPCDDAKRFAISAGGVVVVPRGYQFHTAVERIFSQQRTLRPHRRPVLAPNP